MFNIDFIYIFFFADAGENERRIWKVEIQFDQKWIRCLRCSILNNTNYQASKWKVLKSKQRIVDTNVYTLPLMAAKGFFLLPNQPPWRLYVPGLVVFFVLLIIYDVSAQNALSEYPTKDGSKWKTEFADCNNKRAIEKWFHIAVEIRIFSISHWVKLKVIISVNFTREKLVIE